ncbi:hypothetical protein AUEXF2481DRAFT_48169 [Aureobasidium subglaciale EXF-2481]|uniref:C2 domain-containing protein n=1 Tax=Aureobasidium subglaciale (strain EXF-2481) TaxID=1043005 RepID=A0A074Y732_AURSE|nr:uncharacterized protein AUEXF2481DRAFT_48169 [Aureobasidium subglaciale EXF-2481]KEQ91779.1 hypothetical protein AUEXF2481DRAFT_48169 [Aureobasidium subglaciale EXF-2481]
MSRLHSGAHEKGDDAPEPIHLDADRQSSTADSHDAEKQGLRAQQKEEAQANSDEAKAEGSTDGEPAGGYDATPVPRAPPGWTVKITFHRATNLPMADVNSLSSDPFVLAQINTAMPKRHKEDPLLRMRTPTIRRNTDPEWNFDWIVGNIPSSGFKLKARVYDEDPNDHDDRLGNVHISIHDINENWPGIEEQPYKIMKRSGSKRAYAIRAVAACMSKAKSMHGDLYVSIKLLGRTDIDNGGHVFTIGPSWWIKHQAPMLGRLAGRKEPTGGATESEKEKNKTERYNFQANQIQFRGPVPDGLYHRYVEFRPFVKAMFTSTGVRGFVLSKALHHQHARVYNFDRTTKWGHFPQGPCKEMTQAFLDLVHYDEGGRIFTYVLSLDSLFRFTETGKEFGIDMLSKHTMHSDVSVYIAFSGEFFIRRLKYKNKPPPPDAADSGSAGSENGDSAHTDGANESHPPHDLDNGPPNDEPPKDPAHYQLVIDNDSGTYRPNAKMLPLLKKYLAANLPGLHIQTLDCQADEQKMNRMKKAQRDKKKKEGDQIVYAQAGSDASKAAGEEDAAGGGATGLAHQLKQDAGFKGKARLDHWKHNLPGQARD